MRRFIRAMPLLAPVAVAVGGCNLITGANDFYVEEGANAGVAPDAAGESPPGSHDAAATTVCPRGLADCNEDLADGCEVDTGSDIQNCGKCGAVCMPGATCASGGCGPPPSSCNALLVAAPGTPSGIYLLDPDGAGDAAAFLARCDMTTAGGGWTIVFFPDGEQQYVLGLDYTTKSSDLLSAATEALLAYRDANGVTVGTTAALALPEDWRSAPFQTSAQDVDLTVNFDGVTSVKTLRYGYASFYGSLCDDEWNAQDAFGRICIVGSNAPYYSGFASAGADYCSESSAVYSGAACTIERRFTIGVR